MTFNGKAKSTSQFYYNLAQDRDEDILNKLEGVIKDYFVYYSGFQNKDEINEISCHSIDFKCDNKCVINVNHRVNVIGLIFTQEELKEITEKLANKYQVPVKII